MTPDLDTLAALVTPGTTYDSLSEGARINVDIAAEYLGRARDVVAGEQTRMPDLFGQGSMTDTWRPDSDPGTWRPDSDPLYIKD